MSVRIDEKNNFFSLKTKNTEYQIMADKYGVLKHIWYGGIVDNNMDYMLKYPDVGFSGNPYDAGNDRTYSLDTLPLEYSSAGTGDFRISASSVTHENGSNALDLRYKGYSLKKGKYSVKGMPAVYAQEDESETLEITLCDTVSGVEVILRYGIIPEYDIITRCAVFRNSGDKTITINKAASVCLDFPHDKWDWIHFHGRHAMERIAERTSLIHGIQEVSSKRGTSSHHHNPSVVLCSPDCTEQTGRCIGMFLVYSGSFQTQIELDQLNQTRLVMGINPDLFEWKLESGETFETPEAVFTYSANGLSQMTHNLHGIIREHICRGKYKLAKRPVLINNWEATYFDFNDEKILEIAEKASEIGIDMLVLDDGWFGKRDSDCSGLGDWFVNENKIKCGLGQLAEKIKKFGMKFGLWFEPEMISEDSDLYRSHSEWAIKIPDRNPMRGRYQLLLDMSREDVRQYLYERISSILKSADISYVKWDMNRSICDWYSQKLNTENQLELPHRYILGLYSLLERLTSEFPDVLFEGCSGGGGRFDAGMLYYSPQIWCSDDTDAYERTKIQYGTSMIYPVSAVGSHVSIVPNHQTGRITPMETRGITAMAGSFGYELDLSKISDEDKIIAKNQISQFRKYSELIHNGRYYRLSNPFEDSNALWCFVSDNKEEILIQGMIFRTAPNMKRDAVKLAGLNPDYVYLDEKSSESYTGAALMNGGILLPQSWGDYYPVEFYLKRAK